MEYDNRRYEIEFALNAIAKICGMFDIALIAKEDDNKAFIKILDKKTKEEYFITKEGD